MGTVPLGARADSGSVCTRDEVLTADLRRMESYHHRQNTESQGLIRTIHLQNKKYTSTLLTTKETKYQISSTRRQENEALTVWYAHMRVFGWRFEVILRMTPVERENFGRDKLQKKNNK